MPLQSSLPSVSAKALLLDLLRMVHPLALPVALLVNAARVLNINENVLRVNITRLASKQQIEQDERGYYRLGKESVHHDAWLRQWQAGEARVSAWQGDWLVLNSSQALKAKEQQSLHKMVHHLGFRELMLGVWIRPNNLLRTIEELSEQITLLAHSNAFVIVESQKIVHPNKELRIESLWDSALLEAQYQDIIGTLEEGITKAKQLSVEDAFRDSYFVGAEVHHRLALDPLLPKEMVDVKLRKKVVERFAAYDALYRSAWIEFFQGYVLKVSSRALNSKILMLGAAI